MLPSDQNYRQAAPAKPAKPASIYRGHSFTLGLLDGWQDKTVYTLTGSVENGIQHNIIINVEPDTPFEAVRDYAEWQIAALEGELKGCRLLKKGEIALANGLPAYEAIFSWYPTDTLRVYQHQIFVVVEKTAYKLTTTFTKKTRKTLGPQVERILLSFNPNGLAPSTEGKAQRV